MNIVELIKGAAALGLARIRKDANGNMALVGADSVIETVARRATPVRVATFGDSTAALGNTTIPTDNQDATVFTAPFPATGLANSVNWASTKWALTLRYHQAQAVFNGGIGGETTTLMLARDAAVASTTRRAITDLINSRPDVAILRGGSINDLMTVTSATLTATVDAVYARHVTIINRILSAGIPVIDEGIYGYSTDTSADPAATRAALLLLNDKFKLYAAGKRNVRFIDYSGVLSGNDGNFLSDMSYDGTHLSMWGQYIAAEKEAEALVQMFGSPSLQRFPGINMISNSLMTTSTAQSYGTLATGFVLGASNATRENAKIEVIEDRVWQTVELLPTAPNNYGAIYVPFDVTAKGIVANDIFGFEFDFFVTNADGGAPLSPLNVFSARVELYKTAAGRVIYDALVPNVSVDTPGIFRGKAVFGPLQIQEASAALTTSSSFYVRIGGAGMDRYKIGLSAPRMVKL